MIRLTVMMYIRYPLSLRQVEDRLFVREGLSACPLLLMATSRHGRGRLKPNLAHMNYTP